MRNVEVIDVGDTPGKWLKLMLHLQNATPGVYQLIFPDSRAANSAARCMNVNREKCPAWFHADIIQRGCCVYYIKTKYVKKVKIQ